MINTSFYAPGEEPPPPGPIVTEPAPPILPRHPGDPAGRDLVIAEVAAAETPEALRAVTVGRTFSRWSGDDVAALRVAIDARAAEFAEIERLEAERLAEAERAEAERVEAERAEAERVEAERVEAALAIAAEEARAEEERAAEREAEAVADDLSADEAPVSTDRPDAEPLLSTDPPPAVDDPPKEG